jgi:hypothetical protein
MQQHLQDASNPFYARRKSASAFAMKRKAYSRIFMKTIASPNRLLVHYLHVTGRLWVRLPGSLVGRGNECAKCFMLGEQAEFWLN